MLLLQSDPYSCYRQLPKASNDWALFPPKSLIIPVQAAAVHDALAAQVVTVAAVEKTRVVLSGWLAQTVTVTTPFAPVVLPPLPPSLRAELVPGTKLAPVTEL